MTLTLRVRDLPSRSAVAEMATRHDLTLPKDYERFLLERNGGRCLSGGLFRDASTHEVISRVSTFLGIGGPDYEDVEVSLRDLRGRIPDGALPIAYDDGGNLLLLDCGAGSSNGRVGFLSLEDADFDDPPGPDDLIVVADSFSRLLDQLDED